MIEQKGMSLIEVMIALALLIAFLSVFIVVTEFTTRFIRTASESSIEGSQGLLLDQHSLQLAMDSLVARLEQAAILNSEVVEITQKSCSFDPVREWNLPGSRLSDVPPGYCFRLRSTSLSESNLVNLSARANGAKPGIYVIQALPEQVSAATIATRRIFCRPKPFC